MNTTDDIADNCSHLDELVNRHHIIILSKPLEYTSAESIQRPRSEHVHEVSAKTDANSQSVRNHNQLLCTAAASRDFVVVDVSVLLTGVTFNFS